MQNLWGLSQCFQNLRNEVREVWPSATKKANRCRPLMSNNLWEKLDSKSRGSGNPWGQPRLTSPLASDLQIRCEYTLPLTPAILAWCCIFALQSTLLERGRTTARKSTRILGGLCFSLLKKERKILKGAGSKSYTVKKAVELLDVPSKNTFLM